MPLIRKLALAALLLSVAGLPRMAFAQADSVPAPADFIVREGDILHVRIWPNAELGGDFPVEESGFVSLPIVGQLRAAGRPLSEFRQELRELYGRAMKNPVVSVTPEFQVAVLGAVMRPGLYPARPTHTLSDVIGLAGGLREDAREDRVRLVRGGRVIEMAASAAMGEGAGSAEMALQSGDRIIVPERKRSPLTVQNVSAVLQSGTFLLTIITFLRKE